MTRSIPPLLLVPDEIVITRILVLRNKKVMLDHDIAQLYGVSTKRLNEQVKRNKTRFPQDFMFQLTPEEKGEVVANCDHLRKLKYSPNLPFAFTEHGAVMLASVLNSDRAIAVNIQIVRIFIQVREMSAANTDILLKIELLEKKATGHDDAIQKIFGALKKLLTPPKEPRERIGFKP